MLRPGSFMGRIGRGCDADRMRSPLLLLSLPAMLAPGAAGACRMAPVADGPAAARHAVDAAAAIVDGEVIRPFVPGGPPALVRVHRLFKGPQQAEFEVGALTDCDIALTRQGERSRMILTGGPDVWFIHMTTLGERAVDSVLGSDRRRDWPFVRGIVTP